MPRLERVGLALGKQSILAVDSYSRIVSIPIHTTTNTTTVLMSVYMYIYLRRLHACMPFSCIDINPGGRGGTVVSTVYAAALQVSIASRTKIPSTIACASSVHIFAGAGKGPARPRSEDEDSEVSQ